ncbi:hypothetical protein GGI07_002784 [Coemansia sp. Benny D115]|nr:hypothetical protein GGI07_002784 [Coemansia sp. Benny D115]
MANGNTNQPQYTVPSKDLDWWSEDAMVRFGTNTQKTTEPAWQDVGANVLRMDSLYDASFHDWLKCEDNVSTIASYLQRIANEYPMDRIINALRWLVSSWRLESTAVIVRHITADWALPQNPPKPSTAASPFRRDTAIHSAASSAQNDPAVLSGEARRGVLVRELTKDWTCQQIAQLVGMLALTFWSERTHLEAFLRTLVSDWDFCRLSSFFSYVSGQLGLDYRVKVSMLQQAARRNASRLSLKRARNGAAKAAGAAKQPAVGESDESDGVNKRARSDAAAAIEEGATSASTTSSSATLQTIAQQQEIPMSASVSRAAASAVCVSTAHTIAPLSAASPAHSDPPAATTAAASHAGGAAADPVAPPVRRPRTTTSAAATSASALAARASRSGHMPTPLHSVRPSMLAVPAAAHRQSQAGSATTPSSPAAHPGPTESSASASQPALDTVSSMDADSAEIPMSSSSTDLASMPYSATTQSSGSQQQSTPPQRWRARNNTSASAVTTTTATGASSSFDRADSLRHHHHHHQCAGPSGSSSAVASRRPLTPQMAPSVFTVGGAESQQSSPSLRRRQLQLQQRPNGHNHHAFHHRLHHHDCPQPLTPAHTSSGLSIIGDSSEAISEPSGSSSSRPMRLHAASISASSSESPSLLAVGVVGGGGGGGSGGSDHGDAGVIVVSLQAPDVLIEQEQHDEFRARTASESELGQFDGPGSSHLALPLPSEPAASHSSSLCGRSSAAAHYDVLGIVMGTESSEHHLTTGSSV